MGDLDGLRNVGGELKKLLKAYKVSELDEQFTTACPFYKPKETGFSSAYSKIHDMACSLIFTKLQRKFMFSEISISHEVPLKYGRVDGIVRNDKNGEILMLIEVKTGSIKIVQPAVYTLLSGKKTLVVEVKTGYVHVIDVDLASITVKAYIDLMKSKKDLMDFGIAIKGLKCRHCGEDCDYREAVNRETARWDTSPLTSLQAILGNIDTVVDKIAAEIAREVEKTGEDLVVPVEV